MNPGTIKYRAWDKDGKLVPNAITFNVTPQGFVWPEVPHVGMKAYEQFTGALDENGAEIYEGDILVFKEEYGAVVWQGQGWTLNPQVYGNPGGYFVGNWSSMVEVVGNIHEHPELIPASVGADSTQSTK